MQAPEKKPRITNVQYNGVVQAQCSHVCVKATVEVPNGEEYVFCLQRRWQAEHPSFPVSYKSVDMAHKMGLEVSGFGNITSDDTAPPAAFCYDAMCNYIKNLVSRWSQTPELAMFTFVFANALILIGAAHVYAHVDVCKYIYGPFYVPTAAHFHGETAEHFWAFSNKFAALIFQMNFYNGRELYFHLAMQWNWKKEASMRMYNLTTETIH